MCNGLLGLFLGALPSLGSILRHGLLVLSTLILDLGLGSSGASPTTGLDQLPAAGFLAGRFDRAFASTGFDETRLPLPNSCRLFGARLETLLSATSGTTGGQIGLCGNPLA